MTGLEAAVAFTLGILVLGVGFSPLKGAMTAVILGCVLVLRSERCTRSLLQVTLQPILTEMLLFKEVRTRLLNSCVPTPKGFSQCQSLFR